MSAENGSKKRSFFDDVRMLLKVVRMGARLSPQAFPVYTLQAVVEAIQPFITIVFPAWILNELLGRGDPRRLAGLVLATVGIHLLLQLLKQGLQRKVELLDIELDLRLVAEISRKTMTMDYEHIENPRVLDKYNDYREARSFIPSRVESQMKLFGQILKSLIQLVSSVGLVWGLITLPPSGGYSGLLALFDSRWSILLLLGLILLLVLVRTRSVQASSRYFFDFIRSTRWVNRKSNYYGHNLLDDYRFGKDIRLYKINDLIESDLDAFRLLNMANTNKMYRSILPYTTASTALTALSTGAIYLYVAVKALLGSVAAGSAMMYIGAINQFNTALSDLAEQFTTVGQLAPHSAFYFAYLDLPPMKRKGKRPIAAEQGKEYELEFRGVSFRYPGSEQPVLKDISLKLKPGQRTAVVGMNGAGKTTFIKLLCRLYDPTAGQILLNGVDIRDYDYDDYLRLFSVVFQDFQLFAYPVAENVAASERYDPDKVWSSLQGSGADERVRAMPQGLQQFLYKNVSGDGVEISGGEAQKIAISRALYKDAPLVILDEPTAALDPISEYEIYAHFDTLIRGRTALYISHRLSSCRFCDDIIVFHQGEVIQRGSHEELLRQEAGKYAEMWQAQQQYYVERK